MNVPCFITGHEETGGGVLKFPESSDTETLACLQHLEMTGGFRHAGSPHRRTLNAGHPLFFSESSYNSNSLVRAVRAMGNLLRSTMPIKVEQDGRQDWPETTVRSSEGQDHP